MEKFKIEHFENDHPGKKFPWFRTLQSSEAEKFKQSFSSRLSLDANTTSENLVRIILEKSNFIETIQADSEHFSISKLLNSIGVFPMNNICLNWYRFDEIDELYFDDLDKYFDDIWYPGPDDIDIFDQTLSWILTILHDGSVKFLQIEK